MKHKQSSLKTTLSRSISLTSWTRSYWNGHEIQPSQYFAHQPFSGGQYYLRNSTMGFANRYHDHQREQTTYLYLSCSVWCLDV